MTARLRMQALLALLGFGLAWGHSQTSTGAIALTGAIQTQAPVIPVAATPVLSPTSEGFSSSVSVSISDSTPASTIYYTTDDSTPTVASTVYSSAISVTATTTVKAIAAASGYYSSLVGSGVYNLFNSCLIHAWPMNEGSGSTFFDVKGSNNMTLSAGGAITWQANTGMPGTTPYFNGTGHASASYGSDFDFIGTTPFSIVVWVTGSGSATSAAQQWIVGNENWTSPFQGWGVFRNGSSAAANDANSGVFSLINADFSPLSNTALQVNPISGGTGIPIYSSSLHFYGVSYDGSETAAGVNIVQDGTTYNTSNSNLNLVNNTLAGATNNGNAIQVGDAPGGGGVNYTGAISALAIYNCALSAATMNTYYSLGPGRIN